MNCKQGDLALVIHDGLSIKAGAVVVCLEFVGQATSRDWQVFNDVWAVEYRGSDRSPNGWWWGLPDSYLRPIRDNDGDDEMLRIAGLPNKQPEVVL